MGDSPVSGERHQNCGEDTLQLNEDLERMIEDVENISVQLTWMTYDMVVLRTSPDLGNTLQRLEEEFLRCRAVVCGDPMEQEPNQGPRQGKDQGTNVAGQTTVECLEDGAGE
ncbi:hypothetical protein DPEC_G00021080 [Dallia pectoralis]|uniref:Uncharacterized protein n=2 Tax=Dallia pectoralis TaxID=75939 RepID=A0ACC2HH40_DALPE|nr:hypothetical protein DPEC_G00021070 [Dallia pectoralis]KAJ8014950.1 hypothetical protein DPEC_G00021080 [Dallia pectoralis]